MSRNKYAPDISWEDVSTFVREHCASTGYDARIMLHAGTGPGGDDWAEVGLVPQGQREWATPVVQTRGPLPRRQINRQMSVLLHLVARAYQELEANPWLWTPDRRAAARGE